MNVVTNEGTNEQALIKKVCTDLNASSNEIIYSIEEIKTNIFKKYKINASTKYDIAKEIQNYLTNIIKNLGLEVTFEIKIINEKINIKMFSSNNNILIGKNGRTLEALTNLSKQYIYVNYNYKIYLLLDVEDYKEALAKKIEVLALKTAKEVKSTNTLAILENMNSYERRLVHNALVNYQGVTTISEGEEPNRHVIIKPSSK